MRRFSLPSPPLPVFLGLSAALLVFAPLVARSAEEQLVPASLSPKQDAQGYQWDLMPNGAVNDGTNDCFDTGMTLQINGSGVNFASPMMTADGAEYVFNSRSLPIPGRVIVTRRVRLDARRAFLRYLEVLENTGGQTQKCSVTIRSDLGGSCQGVVTSSGASFDGSLGKNDVGFLAVQASNPPRLPQAFQGPSQSRPSVLWLAAGKASKLKPMLNVQSNRSFQMNYSLEIPPKTTVAILYYVAQRRNVTAADAARLFEEIYKNSRLRDPQLPAAARKLVANFKLGGGNGGGNGGGDSASAETASGGAARLQPLQDLLEGAGVTRGERDVLVFGDAGKISGNVTGDDLRVETVYGAATMPLAEVAALVGGAGAQRPMQVYLRSGEILVGKVTAEHLVLTTEAGWKAVIRPEQISLLVMRPAENDGAESPDSGGLLQTTAGDRIALAAAQNCPLEAATPWGTFQTSLDQVSQIVYTREPYPSQHLALVDQSQIFGLLRGGDLTLNTPRFGAVKAPPQTIRNLQRNVKAAKAAAEAPPPAEDAGIPDGDTEEEVKIVPGEQPLCQLAGGNSLVGTIDLPEIHFDTNTGVTALDPKTLRSVQRFDNAKDSEIIFTVKLANGDELTGQIEERILPIRTAQKVWRVPLAHLIAASNPEPAKVPESPAASPSPSPAAEPKP